MAEISKLEHRIMGDYSIAKSFKGILRIAHIKDMGDNTNDYANDEFLNPSFYGTPSELIDISGKESSTSAAGYANAIKALSGGLRRYNRFALDKLRLNRVPVTDSMGNYINWNIGFDGVTIGSNESINGYDQSTTTVKGVTYQRLFPVLKTNNITVGMKKMLLGSDKGAVNQSKVDLEGVNQTPLLVVQNFYDKSDINKSNAGESVFEISEGEGINVNNYKISSRYFKYNDETANGITDLRTIYTNTKDMVEDYDVFMFNQDNYDLIDNVHYAKVDVVNLKKYVKKLIDKFKNGNVIEVPTGAVIWQYCSLDKWRAESENPQGNSIDLESKIGFPGHRPSMEMRENLPNESSNPFFNTLVQGASKKQTYLSAPTQLAKSNKDTSDDSAMTIKEDEGTLLDEVIPLYKRDYVLCDGSVYRIPYLPKGFSSNLSQLMIHRNRFFELFFNLGYKYSSREKMLSRHLSVMDSKNNGTYYLVNEKGSKITDYIFKHTDYNKDNFLMSSHDSFKKLTTGRKIDIWSGEGTPMFVNVSDAIFDKCDDLDVLFQEDLATMLCCDEIYRFVREREKKSEYNFATPTREEIINHLSNTKLPEEYIFNSYIGDTSNDIKTYGSYSAIANNIKLDVIEIPYYNAIGLTSEESKKPILYLGREVSTFGSMMKFYDTTQRKYTNVHVYELPLVTYFIQLITSSKGIDAALVPFLYTFFNFDFQVPHLLAKDKTPVFLGSGTYLYANNFIKSNNNVQSWSSNYDCNYMPHRHYIALSKYKSKDGTSNTYTYEGFNEKPTTKDSYSQYNNTNDLSTSNSVQAEVCNGVTFDCTGDKHGWGKTVTDASRSYIFQDIQVTLRRQIRNSIPVLIAQSEEIKDSDKTDNYNGRQIPYITTGANYSQYENFTFSDGRYKEYYNENKDKWFSFEMGKDDPRFENAEPNRGISDTKSHEDFFFNDLKNAKNLTNFPNSTSPTFFSMENVTMLPLIKL